MLGRNLHNGDAYLLLEIPEQGINNCRGIATERLCCFLEPGLILAPIKFKCFKNQATLSQGISRIKLVGDGF